MKIGHTTKNIIILVSTIVITIIIFYFIQNYNRAIEDKELYKEYISSIEKKESLKEKTETADNSKDELTVGDIYGEYEENKISFNKKNEGKAFEFVGYIDEFTTTLMGCSAIRFNIETEDYTIIGSVNCMNCPELVDKWESEITTLKVDQKVKIRGYYSSSLQENTLTFRNCKIIK
ncbi:OB-fold protein [Pedobacter cryophilus]|uniref:Uncharacterized protein n=1 Tax=Pedobacter cryophilus TaxID=2571271 RepID=A0A4U1BU23_9SPHI|nr:hypothetical protein [Pedobacter cryophilus]TKB95748.1 hypothetical protein FA046_15770 [Pedobacter cryophilus]